jgi:hypothetical protein
MRANFNNFLWIFQLIWLNPRLFVVVALFVVPTLNSSFSGFMFLGKIGGLISQVILFMLPWLSLSH